MDSPKTPTSTPNKYVFYLFLGIAFAVAWLLIGSFRLALCAKLSRMPNSVRTGPSHKCRWPWLQDIEALPLQSSSIPPSSYRKLISHGSPRPILINLAPVPAWMPRPRQLRRRLEHGGWTLTNGRLSDVSLSNIVVLQCKGLLCFVGFDETVAYLHDYIVKNGPFDVSARLNIWINRSCWYCYRVSWVSHRAQVWRLFWPPWWVFLLLEDVRLLTRLFVGGEAWYSSQFPGWAFYS